MKVLISTLIIATVAVSAVNAQFTKYGGGTVLSTGFKFHNMDYDANQSSHFAVFVKGIYEISQPLHISPSFSFFYPEITETGNDKTIVTAMMFDINGHYTITSSGIFQLYGLAGLNILIAWKTDKYQDAENFGESDNAPGINAGAGAGITITENIELFAEIKYIIGKYDQLTVNAGILVSPAWLKKKDGKAMGLNTPSR